MSKIELTAPCNFALEAVLAREIRDLGYETTLVEDGRVNFETDEYGICMSNLWLRTAERILLKVGEFYAETYDDLFESTKKLPWHKWIPRDAEFPVAKASSIKSKLFSASDIQAIVKKAIVESMKQKHKLDWFPESGPKYPIHVFINKDKVVLYIDTTGYALHKRGYREAANEAPIKETLAAAMVMLTPWREDRVLVDPFCGSGTILIEAALIGLNMAPGLNRNFTAEEWEITPKDMWEKAREDARSKIRTDIKMTLQGYDIDEQSLKVARGNARLAGVENQIHFQKRDVRELSSTDKYGFIVTNPPYGERMQDNKSVESLYKDMGKVMKRLDSWSFYIITAHESFEKLFGRRADKKRKLYNGMMKTDFYQFYGPKPPRAPREEKPEESIE
jgi:putative N6-adenine-specific DNA methylase